MRDDARPSHLGANDASKVVILGAGTLGRLIHDCMDGDSRYLPEAFIDDAEAGSVIDGIPILHSQDYNQSFCRRAIVAIGVPQVKAAFVERLAQRGFEWVTFIDRRAHVSTRAFIGDGALVLPFASIGPGVTIGDFAYIAAYASAGTNARIGAYSTLQPRASVGGSIVGERCLIGFNSACLNGAQVGNDVVLAPYTWVRKTVPSAAFVAGNPGRIVRSAGPQIRPPQNVGREVRALG